MPTMPLNQFAFLFNWLALRIYRNGLANPPSIYNIPIRLGARPESEFLHVLDVHF